MKDNLENAFKDSLSNHELPYDSAAWTAMSAKLDAIQPVATTPPASSVGKWIIAAGTVITVSVGAYIYMNNDKEVVESEKITNNVVQKNETVKPTVNTTLDVKQNSQETVVNEEVNPSIDEQKKTTQSPSNPGTNPNIKHSGTPSQLPPAITDETSKNPKITPTINPTVESIIAPTVKDVCEHELTTIKNINSVDLIVLTPNKDRLVIKKQSTFKSDELESGNYKIYANDKLISTFTVNHSPKADFTIDDQTPFEDGLPSLPVETFSEGTKFTWNFDNSKNAAQGRIANAHFFTKGEHSVTLKTQNESGCSSEITKTVEISSDYNLFAPNAFEPNHSDVRRTKFIPNALLVRGSVFTMIIVNPKTGATLYSTSNAADGWDGVDRTTGELVGENETYVWKVFLKNPVAGEKSEYSGTVIRK